MTIKYKVKIPTLLPSILGQCTTSIRPLQSYMDVGISLLRFKYPKTLKKRYQNCNNINYIFPTMFSSKIYPFPYAINKSKEFYCCCYIAKLFLYISFSFFPFSMSFLCLLSCVEFLLFFRWLIIFLHFFGDPFFLFMENTL